MEQIPVVQDYTPPFARDGKFHVRLTEGRFQNWRRLSTWPLIALFFGLAWVQVNGQPWLLFSFEQHRIILFGKALSWHDLPLLAGLMIAGASLLFFLAVAWGRVWCGFACPQSIWTWLFIRIEQFTEGRASKRARQEDQPLGATRLLRRITKHLLWILLACATATTFTGYFVPIREILAAAMGWEMSPALWGWLLIMAALTYANAGLVREKICLHACPYSRFQGVMFDRHTRSVSYDAGRGEPRANLRNTGADSGDCVDCGLCVQVCPTGIDIRDGLQAACIDCAACIDACDEVMDKIKRPRGLVRFASEAQLAGQPSPLKRPLLACYGVVLLGSIGAVAWGFTTTTDLLVEIRRDRDTLFTQQDEHTICNSYRIKLEGFAKDQSLIALSLQGPGDFELFGPASIDLIESNSTWLPYRVCGRDIERSRTLVQFSFEGQGIHRTQLTTFLTRAL
uniref:cytochrome c oxidase accessory protein CcoG n=1 Tax=Marinobacterium profundum TaxID=1714300 RepID=UPI00082E1F55|nr:cytochrome c oxidase accessory protein CcoG [Marinobacterium profundum]